MARRKNSLKKTALMAGGFILAVLVILGVVMGVSAWRERASYVDPASLTTTVRIDGVDTAVSPYAVCEVGAPANDCDGSVFTTDLNSGETVTITVPEEVGDHDWSLLAIYDDPAKNDEHYFRSADPRDVEIPVKKDTATLMMVEVSSMQVQRVDGTETPVVVTWSIADDQA